MAQEEILTARIVTEGLQKYQGDMAKADQTVAKSAKAIDEAGKSGIGFGDVLGGVAKGLAAATAAAATMGLVFKKAMDLGKAGATVIQATASFEGLVEQMELGVDYMGRLETAAGGTIDKLSLMAGVGTLVAGTSAEFGRELANAYPTLVTYARAAAKLNPHLGNTNQMLDSIALGLKRGSPMILDNLGLTIKIGDANEKMAQALGKSATELTAEEKQMALLNATMEAGQRLVEQVGGNVDSAVDSFTRLEVATKNLSDALAAKLAPSLSTAAEAVVLLLGWSDMVNIALAEQEERVLATSDSYRDYVEKMTDALVIAGEMMPRHQATILLMIDEGKSVEDLAGRYNLLTEETFEHAKITEDDRLRVEYHTVAMGEQATAVLSARDAFLLMKEEQRLLAEITQDDRRQTQDWTEAVKIHEAAMVEDEKAVAAAAAAYLVARDAAREAAAATGDYFARTIEATDETWNITDAMWESAKAADLDAVQMAILGGALGLYTEEQIEAALTAAILKIKLDDIATAVANETLTVEAGIEAFYDLKDSMDSIPDRKHLSFTWSMEQTGGPPAGHPQAITGPPAGHPQAGGAVAGTEETVEEQVTRHMRRVSESIATSVQENVGEAVGSGVSSGISEGASRGVSAGIAAAEPTIIEGLLALGRGLGGVGGGLATQFRLAELGPLEEHIELINEEIDAFKELMAAGRVDLSGLSHLSALEKERTEMLQEQARLQEVLLNLEKQRQDLAFLEQQVKLLDLIREYGLDAEDILGGMELGIDASTESLIQAMTAAMQQIIIGIEEELQISSPSLRFAEIGSQMMTGIGQGIAAQVPNIQAQIQTAVLPASVTTSSGDYYDQRQYHHNLTTQSMMRPGGLAMEFAAMEMGSR